MVWEDSINFASRGLLELEAGRRAIDGKWPRDDDSAWRYVAGIQPMAWDTIQYT